MRVRVAFLEIGEWSDLAFVFMYLFFFLKLRSFAGESEYAENLRKAKICVRKFAICGRKKKKKKP